MIIILICVDCVLIICENHYQQLSVSGLLFVGQKTSGKDLYSLDKLGEVHACFISTEGD